MSGENGSFVSLEGVSKSFGELEVLHGIDLAVDLHQVVCLIGASGSGKSTLLRCINLLEQVDAGTIVVDGQTVTGAKVDVNALRQKIGIVFQAYNLFPHMTVLENVTLGPIRARRLPRSRANDEARELLAQIGLEDKADEYPDRLSGGQQQRVAIVRALAMNPTLMLLDEITSALDPQLVGEVLGPRAHARSGGDDDDHRDARDGVRPGGRGQGLLPRRGRDLRGRAAGSDSSRRPGSRARAEFLQRVIEAGRM